MTIKSMRVIEPLIWIPPANFAQWKITVERLDGTVDDITDLITSCTIEDGVTDIIGVFDFTIDNSGETWNNYWSGGETFRYYSDYDSTATTLRFKGKIEKPSKVGLRMRCSGRSMSNHFSNVNVSNSTLQHYAVISLPTLSRRMEMASSLRTTLRHHRKV